MKKFIWLVLFLFAIAFDKVNANSINYELKIDQNKHFYETITYTIENSNDEYLNSILNNDVYFDINNTKKYVKTVTKNNSTNIVVLKYDYDYSVFNTSRIANKCFDEINYETDNNQIVFSTFGDFKCNIADDIKVNIISDIVVITNDADEENENKYTWNVKDEFLYIGIRIGEEKANSGVIAPFKDTKATATEIGDTPTGIKEYNYPLIIGLIVLFVCFLTFIFVMLNKRKNRYNNIN